MKNIIASFAAVVMMASPALAAASVDISLFGTGGTMPYCSGPMAPGWVVSAPGGGCGPSTTFIQSGQSVFFNGKLEQCPFWFPSGCVIK